MDTPTCDVSIRSILKWLVMAYQHHRWSSRGPSCVVSPSTCRAGRGAGEDPGGGGGRHGVQRGPPAGLPENLGQAPRHLGDQQGPLHPALPEAQRTRVHLPRGHRQVWVSERGPVDGVQGFAFVHCYKKVLGM